MPHDPTFRFRLEKILQLRVADRQQRRAELAEAFRAAGVIREQAETLATELQAIKRRALAGASPGMVDVSQLLDVQRYELVLQAQSRVLADRRKQLLDEIQKRREALTESDRQVRVLEKLRDRQLAAHQQQVGKQETRQLDEVAQQRTRRRES